MGNQLTYIPSNIQSGQFPQRFKNEVYLSELINGYIFHSYTSVYSIKYQISGTEIYNLDNKELKLEANKYLIVNNNQHVTSLPYKTERAITIFIEPEIIGDIFSNLRSSDESLLSNPYKYEDEEIKFFEYCFNVKNDPIGKNLEFLANSFDKMKNTPDLIKQEYFYRIARDLILSHQEIFKQIKNIDCTKSSTKVELFRRMKLAEQIINDNWNRCISLNSVSSQVCMSSYHFHRTFSKTFSMPPLEYHLKVRLKKSKEILESKRYQISDVAVLAGYNDVFSFSKAFKKMYGVSPSTYLNVKKPN